MIPYTFSVPDNWEEARIHFFTTYSGSLFMFSPVEQVPVSIADLGGTEIDLRFANPKEGRIFVIVAPILEVFQRHLFWIDC